LISLLFIFGEMWSGNKEGGDDHIKGTEKRRPGVKKQNVLNYRPVGP
jgi:hypothetical protein